jgi:hypothetical protein
MAEPRPCDHLVEPFHRTGYCFNCNVLAELHTPEGWADFYERQAKACEGQAGSHERRAFELREAAAEATIKSRSFPTPRVRCKGYWSSRKGLGDETADCVYCGRPKDDPLHATAVTTEVLG